MKRFISVLPFCYLFLFLTNISLTKALAKEGLLLWFEKMIPTLFPFMVISSMLIHINEGLHFSKQKLPRRFLPLSNSGLYCLFMGILCGFPIGGYCLNEFYRKGQISAKECEILMPVCNQLSPAYLLGYAFPIIFTDESSFFLKLMFFSVMYFVPVLYCSIYLRHRRLSFLPSKTNYYTSSTESFAIILSKSLISAGKAILRLGAFLIFFRVLFLPIELWINNPLLRASLQVIFEIMSGTTLFATLPVIHSIGGRLFLLGALSFCGICCHAQLLPWLSNIGLSPAKYLWMRLKITGMELCIYLILFAFYSMPCFSQNLSKDFWIIVSALSHNL